MQKILEKIEKKVGIPGIIEQIADKLSPSELNSFLLELLNYKTKKIAAAKVLNDFRISRFSKPSLINPVHYKEYEIKWLKKAEPEGFIPIQLSPLAPLGTCSAIAKVNQNNIVSAVRGTEVVSDVTNVLALLIADEFKKERRKGILKYCTTHRHVRAQYFTNPLFSAHFGLFCMVTGGYDTGGYSFELENFKEHINFYIKLLTKEFDTKNLSLKIELRGDDEIFHNKMKGHLEDIQDSVKINFTRENANSYYQLCRFKIFLNEEIDLADGGFTDWTQKLMENKKQRLMISACGIEMVYKIKSGGM